MNARNTRSAILDMAVGLFNQHGSQSVSTNRIAAEMGISVGNLYYHFNNKEDVIRALYDRMAAEMDDLWSGAVGFNIPRLKEMIDRLIQQMWEYRFFQREQLTLMKKDPLLLKKNQEVRLRKRGEIEGFIRGLAEANILRQTQDEETIPALVNAVWIVSENWLAFLELEGKSVSRKNIQAGTNLILQFMRPYLSPGAITELSH
jgi:AcrR family transcriptional regulator